jgi:hypothetical protein
LTAWAGVHPLLAEGRRGVFEQSDVIPQLHAEAAGRLNAGVGDQTDQDDAADAVLPQLQIEVGVGEAARSPVLTGDDIPRLRLEIIMKRPAPAGFGEGLRPGRPELIRRGKVERDVIARLPAVMQDEEDPQPVSPRG